MSINNEALLIILLLLPGFFGVGVYSFVSATQPSTANSIIFAIFLIIVSNFVSEKLNLIDIDPTDMTKTTIFASNMFSYMMVLGIISSIL